jgi:hypothetical protein
MTYQLTVNSGKANVIAPNGDRYQAGQSFTVTDDQYGNIRASTITALFAKTYLGGTVSHMVTIASGKQNVVLPNGRRANAGDVVVLSDAQYSTIDAAAKAALFSADTTTLT